jgi:hypothetical protein
MSNFEEVIEKFLRPKALSENFDHSTWSDERSVWILSSALGLDVAASEEGPVFVAGNLISASQQPGSDDLIPVKLANGKVTLILFFDDSYYLYCTIFGGL